MVTQGRDDASGGGGGGAGGVFIFDSISDGYIIVLAQVAVRLEDHGIVVLEHQEVMEEIGNQYLDHYQDLVMEDGSQR